MESVKQNPVSLICALEWWKKEKHTITAVICNLWFKNPYIGLPSFLSKIYGSYFWKVLKLALFEIFQYSYKIKSNTNFVINCWYLVITTIGKGQNPNGYKVLARFKFYAKFGQNILYYILFRMLFSLFIQFWHILHPFHSY